MSLLAEFDALSDRAERRSGARRALRLSVGANLFGSSDQSVRVHDLSESGMLIETPEALASGETFEVIMPLAGAIDATVVWRSSNFYGCEFNRAVPSAAISAALLRSEPKVVEVEPTHPSTDLLSQLRSINSSIEQVGHQLDDTIDQLRGDRGPVHARRWESDEDYSRSSETPESDGSDWVVVITLILAGLAGLILVAALLGSPLVP